MSTLHTDVVQDRTTFSPPTYPQVRKRNIDLTFDVAGDEVRVNASGPGLPEIGDRLAGTLDVSPSDIETSVLRLRETWRKEVLDLAVQDPVTGRRRYPFAEHWHVDGNIPPDLWNRAMLQLADHGHRLYSMLFFGKDRNVALLGDLLAKALHGEKQQLIRVHSEDLFIPWTMLYSPREGHVNLSRPGAEWSFEGFWGYRHLVEQTVRAGLAFDARIRPRDGKLHTGLNVDPKLDIEFHPHRCVATVSDFLRARAELSVLERTTRDGIAADFSSGVLDQILYFCSHAELIKLGNSGRMDHVLRFGEDYVSSDDFRVWLEESRLRATPVVFTNVCQGGTFDSGFYGSFGKEIFNAGANCLIGPQVDIPPAFARDYAVHFFTDFFKPGSRIGDVVHGMAQRLARQWNPFGLAISLYRGLDTHIEPPDAAVREAP